MAILEIGRRRQSALVAAAGRDGEDTTAGAAIPDGTDHVAWLEGHVQSRATALD
jgi:hypothetical protein